jgi:uncharacterized protein YdeI (YjbR/CyaY-like superfamily)
MSGPTRVGLGDATRKLKEEVVRNGLSGLKRPRHPMPDFVKHTLEEHCLMEAYRERPAYQQNDYIGWISRAKREETKQKRLRQMLDELQAGGIYMNMKHTPSEKK